MDPGFGHNNQSEEKLFGNSVLSLFRLCAKSVYEFEIYS